MTKPEDSTPLVRKYLIGDLEERGDFMWDTSGDVLGMLLCLGDTHYIGLFMWRASDSWTKPGSICAWNGQLNKPTLKQSVNIPDWNEHFYITDGVLE